MRCARRWQTSGHMRRISGERGVTDEEHVEIIGEVIVTGARFGVAHVGGVAGKENMANTLLAQKIAKPGIAFSIVDNDIIGLRIDVRGDGIGRSQYPGPL